MDDAPFALSESLRVLHQAGIRFLLARPAAPPGHEEPEPQWGAVLAKMPPAPFVLLTYLELGADLTGQADARRGALWRRLIGELGLPKGSLGFLPYAFPEGCDQKLALKNFFVHLKRIAPRYLLIFDKASPHPIATAFPGHMESSAPAVSIKHYPSAADVLSLSTLQFLDLAQELRLVLNP